MAEYQESICTLGNLNVRIRSAEASDATSMIEHMRQVDLETQFLAREPDEFTCTVEEEERLIGKWKASDHDLMLLAVIDDHVIATASLFINPRKRYRHKAGFAIAVQKPYWSIGIGRKMLNECIDWCRDRQLVKMELDVDTGNQRALSLYMSLGFEIEGTIRKERRMADGSFRDGYKMGLMLGT